MYFAVSIDGPSGAGKSTIARAIAQKLNFLYVDTGALYRAVGYYMLQNGVDVKDENSVSAALKGTEVALKYQDGQQQVFLNGENVSEKIRTQEVASAASAVSALSAVRAFLLDQQQNIARQNNVIMDGRDIGTVVLPWAQVKIFLTATAEERAKRRHLELVEKKTGTDYETVLGQIIKRDEDDSSRAIAPLKKPEDAVLVDTTSLTFDEVAATVTNIIKDRLNEGDKDVL